MHNIFNSTLAMFRKPQNGMDRSCAATIYPVLDKPGNSEALGPRGPLLKEICPLVFKIPFTIRLDHR
jgi:hypothetical protein